MPLCYALGIAAALLSFIVLIIVLRRKANQGLEPLVTAKLTPKDGKALIVLVHGTRGTGEFFNCLHAVLEEVRRTADILVIGYPSGILSNASTFLVSEEICQKIHEAYVQKQYESIILVGYSKGALLIRKAFVYGYGKIEDLEAGGSRQPMPWTQTVERLVLLAGMNRGWTLRRRPEAMKRSRYWSMKLLYHFARWIGIGALMRQCESGEPFVANLRIQWLDLMRGLPVEQRPTVVQLLGTKDDLVASEDQRDVTVAKDFIWVRVNNTGHADIIDLDHPLFGEERRAKLKKALGERDEIESLRRLSTKLPDNEDPLVHEVVVVLHGIRDLAAWTSQFGEPLQQAYQAKHPDSASKIHITWPSYGYFGMGPFLLWSDRQTNVRWFMDEFTEIKARYPNLRKVHFICHSNGTYVLASALQNYRTLKVGNIAFGGSVLRRDFEWDRVGSQFDKLRNYVGYSDCVVGWFPRLFEFPLFRFINRDIGYAGFAGFTKARGNEMETRFLNGGHGVALHRKNIDSIVQFIINGKKIDEQSLLISEDHTPWLEYSSKFCWVVWLIIVGVAAGLFMLWLQLVKAFAPDALQPFHMAVAIVTFALAVVALLKNV